jgi:hypothetical protein
VIDLVMEGGAEGNETKRSRHVPDARHTAVQTELQHGRKGDTNNQVEISQQHREVVDRYLGSDGWGSEF